MTVVALIQARTTSTRLPGKVLLPAAGREMPANRIDRVLIGLAVAVLEASAEPD